jgi:hypothetical protein
MIPIECPFCGEPTAANRLPDGSLVCSCAAERNLPESALPGPRPAPSPHQPGAKP